MPASRRSSRPPAAHSHGHGHGHGHAPARRRVADPVVSISTDPVVLASTLHAQQGRLDRLESSVENITQMLQDSIEAQNDNSARTQEDYQRGREDLRQQIVALGKEFANARATNWPLMTSVAGLIIAIGAIVVGFVKMSQDPLREAIGDSHTQLVEHRVIGHPDIAVNLARHDTVLNLTKDEIADLRRTLSAQHAEGDALATTLRTAVASLETRVGMINERNRISDEWWRESRQVDKESIATRARQDELTRAMVRDLAQLREDIAKNSTDRFYGREGQELRQRIAVLEQLLMKGQPAGTP